MTQTDAPPARAPYRFQAKGPDLDTPFKVLAGFALIHLCDRGRILLLAGAGWPGLDRLPSALIDQLEPSDCTLGPDTRIEPGLAESEIPQALLVIETQALTSLGALPDRMQMAERLGYRLREMPRETAAGLIAASREHISKLFGIPRVPR